MAGALARPHPLGGLGWAPSFFVAFRRWRASALLCLVLTITLAIFYVAGNAFPSEMKTLSEKCPSAPKDKCAMGGPGVPTFKVRTDLGAILQDEGLTRGVELGVQTGLYARAILKRWRNCTEYHLVDLWAVQENYKDIANVDQAQQDRNYNEALQRLEPFQDKIRVCRNYTSTCVREFEDEYFDFVYVDARHDFKGVWEDLRNYWPKLRPGGIMAGHDYVTQAEVSRSGQNWTVNYDGTIDETGTVVKGAVDKFASSVCRQITVSYREQGWNTWAMRK